MRAHSGSRPAELRAPKIAAGGKPVHEDAAFNGASALLGLGEHRLVESVAGERERREWQRRLQSGSICREAHEADGCRTQADWIDAGLAQIIDGLAAQKFAADLVMRGALFLKEGYAAACRGQTHRDH